MNVILRVFWKLKVYDMGDPVNVYSAASYVGSDKILEFSFLEPVERRQTFLLRNITRNTFAMDTLFAYLA